MPLALIGLVTISGSTAAIIYGQKLITTKFVAAEKMSQDCQASGSRLIINYNHWLSHLQIICRTHPDKMKKRRPVTEIQVIRTW